MEAPRDLAPPQPVTGRVMVYDGDCPLCIGLSAAFVRLGLIPEHERRPYQAFGGPLQDRMWEAGIRNEMLVLDPASGELRAGAAGILWMLGATWIGPLAKLLARRPLLDLVSGLYRFVAYNRRFLSVPKPRAIACACDPDERPRTTWALILAAGVLALGAATLVGLGGPPELRLVGSRLGPVGPPAKAFGPWLLPLLGLVTIPAGQRLRVLGHLAATAGLGGLVFLPLGLVAWISPSTVHQAYGTLVQLSCLVAGGWMFVQQRRRAAFLGLPARWLVLWTVGAAIGLGAFGWLHVLR